jgi:hypothetical protein
LFPTPEEAVAAGREFWPTDVFHVEQVRAAKLSDYFRADDLTGALRERMAAISGDDSVMDTRITPEGALPNEGDSVFADPLLSLSIGETLDAFAEFHHLDLSALQIVEHRMTVKPATP